MSASSTNIGCFPFTSAYDEDDDLFAAATATASASDSDNAFQRASSSSSSILLRLAIGDWSPALPLPLATGVPPSSSTGIQSQFHSDAYWDFFFPLPPRSPITVFTAAFYAYPAVLTVYPYQVTTAPAAYAATDRTGSHNANL